MCKTCTKCGITYKNINENFYKQKNSYRSECKKCKARSPNYAENNRVYYHKHKKVRARCPNNPETTKNYYKSNKEIILDQKKNERINLDDAYIKHRIRQSRLYNVKNPTPEYIEAYRQVILLKREQRQLINLTKSLKNGNSINL